MGADASRDFAKYLASRQLIRGAVLSAERHSDLEKAESGFKTLWQMTALSASDFADEVARFCGLPRITLAEMIAASALTDRFTHRFLRDTAIYPMQTPDGHYKLAVADPSDSATLNAVEIVLGAPFEIEIASFEDLGIVLAERLDKHNGADVDTLDAAVADSDDDIESLRDLASGAPVVRAVNDLLEKAVELRASDIHIEPFRSGLVVRMRVDGLLRTVTTPVGVLPQAIVSRIKILSGLNIAERRLSQDGAARLRIARSDLDIRVATMPTQHGESAVIRLLPKDRGLLDIAKLGLSNLDGSKLERFLALPHGMIIVTGPTGSGKTTTLATMLSILNEPTRKILTIEDPVEYEIPGINQSQVKPAIGLTFAAALRAFVRQDPDVIMVGEVRDAETAHIAVHAALTGHLVLTTLHTESAAAAVPRLLDLGVEPFLLKSTLRGVIAQRLVRILCDRCKVRRSLTSADLGGDPRYAMLGFSADDVVWEPGRCERCGGTGYRGRSGVFEILEMADGVRELIGSHTDSGSLEKTAMRAGMVTMIADAIAKCRAGLTSPAEVLRVTTAR